MAESSCRYDFTGIARLKLFWALSRTPHGLLDMCTAALAALLWLGHFPEFKIIGLGLITVFAGYTAVYALNDVVGYRSDKKKVQQGNLRGIEDCEDLDAMLMRYPMARGLLSFKEGLVWAVAWALLALIGAYLLNPICVLIFVGGCILETVYCLMWNISPSRTLLSGVVKAAGPIAAVFAVDPNPSAPYLIVLFFLIFFWEIGGQNVPNDWIDIEEDVRFGARTVPIRLGIEEANVIIFGSVILTVILSGILLILSPITFKLPFIIAFAFVGFYFLLMPTIKLYQSEESTHALVLFNKASYYPLALLAVVVIKLIICVNIFALGGALMQEFDIAELGKYDGNDGRPVYVAYKGKVYDISDSKLWRNGLHMKRHHAGQDMTTDIQGAPHEPDVLERYPQVATLKKESAEVAELAIPPSLAWLLEKVPMLRRHPHPMTVHFPIVFAFSTTIFNILYLIFGIKSLEVTALHCLGAGILFTVVAIVTGLYTWWLNYMAKPLRAVNIKLTFALILLAVQVITFIWRLKVPQVMESIQGANTIYLLLVLSLFPIVVVIGWFGAFLTFPVEKD